MRLLIVCVALLSACTAKVEVDALTAIDGAAVVALREVSDAQPRAASIGYVTPEGLAWRVDTSPWRVVGLHSAAVVATGDRVVALLRDEHDIVAIRQTAQRVLDPWPHHLEAFARADGRRLWQAELPPITVIATMTIADEQPLVLSGAHVIVAGDLAIERREPTRVGVWVHALSDGTRVSAVELPHSGDLAALFAGSRRAAVVTREPHRLDLVTLADGASTSASLASPVACQSDDTLMVQRDDGVYLVSLADGESRRLAASTGTLTHCGRRGDGWVIVEASSFRGPGRARGVASDGGVRWDTPLPFEPYAILPATAVRAELGPRLPIILRGTPDDFGLVVLDTTRGTVSALQSGRSAWVTVGGHCVLEDAPPDYLGERLAPRARHAFGDTWWSAPVEPSSAGSLRLGVTTLGDDCLRR